MAQHCLHSIALLKLRTSTSSSTYFSAFKTLFSSETEIWVSKQAFVAFSNYGIITSNKQENANDCLRIGNVSLTFLQDDFKCVCECVYF